MECPDDNVLAEFMQGLLSAERRRELEEHLDGCASCASLMVGVGHTFDRGLDLPASSKLGRYEIDGCIGRGGMGTVYAARDPLLARRVALKVLHGEARDRTLHEARALARLSHPNVVSIYDVGEDEGRLYLAMEIVEGTTLTAWLRAEKRPWRDIAAVFASAASGLAAAHAAGVVHGDFKPDNVIVARDGRVCVTDFGLARLLSERDVEAPAAAIAGTPAYMAPEQLEGDRATPASDQFAFCTALYEALYGVRPLEAKTVGELRTQMRARRAVAPPAAPAHDRAVPSWLLGILQTGLAIDPAARFASMDELRRRLARKAGAEAHFAVNGVVQLLMLVPHVAISTLFVWAMASADAPAAAPPASELHHYAMATVVAYWLAALFFFGWAPLGVVWAPLNAYGLFRKRRWALTSTLIYAAFSLPTCLGTPAAIYALVTLWPLRKKEKKRDIVLHASSL